MRAHGRKYFSNYLALVPLSIAQETLPRDCLLCGLCYANVLMLKLFLDTFNPSLSGSASCFETRGKYTTVSN